MKEPIVSIIMPNYNGEQYITDALKSVSAQTEKNWECIIIDDASTDNSVKTIKQYIKKDKRFKLIQLSKQSGPSVARNHGLDTAQGRYIAFLDSDDCYTDTALQTLVQLIETTGADMAGGRTHMIDSAFTFKENPKATFSLEDFVTSYAPEEFLLLPQKHSWCWIWRRIYKRELIGDTRFLPEFTTFGDDLTFMLNIAYRANSSAECNNICVYHRAHQNNISSQDFCENNVTWFPKYFKYIYNNLLDKYNHIFWRKFYTDTFKYLIHETIIKPKQYNTAHAESKAAVIESCKHIPRRYLRFKQRILCWFLSCLK